MGEYVQVEGTQSAKSLKLVWLNTLDFSLRIPGCFKSLLKCHLLSDVTTLQFVVHVSMLCPLLCMSYSLTYYAFYLMNIVCFSPLECQLQRARFCVFLFCFFQCWIPTPRTMPGIYYLLNVFMKRIC